MTAKPNNRQMFRYFLSGFAIGAVGLIGMQTVQAEPSHAPTVQAVQNAAR